VEHEQRLEAYLKNQSNRMISPIMLKLNKKLVLTSAILLNLIASFNRAKRACTEIIDPVKPSEIQPE
jgi:hypothetical protein